MSTMRRDQKFQQETKNPSFSSTLLDEIYRSIDESDQKTAKPIVMRKKQSNVPLKNTEEDEIANFRRARLVEQWMEKKATEKMVSRKQQISPEFQRKSKCENDALFFSSSSCSSDSSSGQFSSSETEITTTKPSKKKVASCFTKGMPKPKPIRTEKSARTEKKTGEDALFHKKQSQIHEDKQGVIKSKLKALNIYNNLKQPISPGARISTFLNSIFATKSSKNTKNSTFDGSFRDMGMEKTPKSPTTCSTASSFTRSCLSKKLPSVRENTRINGVQRSVKFVNEDCRQIPTLPISRKSANSSTLKRDEEVKFQAREKNRRAEEAAALDVSKHCREKNGLRNGDYRVNHEDYANDDDDDDDAASDCSSDLFELDHHKFSGKNGQYYCEELPVYETTHVVTNRAIANRM